MLSVSFRGCQFIALLLIFKITLGCSQVSNKNQISSIVNDVRNNRFSAAEQTISNVVVVDDKEENNQVIPAVVHIVYAKNVNNTQLILDFAHNMTKTNLSFHILKELKNQLTTNNHTEPLRLINLYRAVEDAVIFKTGPKPQLTPEITAFIEEIKANVTTSATKVLKAAMFANDFESNDYIQNVTNGLFNFYYEISDAVMLALVNETYPAVAATQVAENIMFGSNYIPQKIKFFVALYEKLEAEKDLNNEAILKIAYYVRILKKWNTYKNLFQPLKYAANAMIKRMPICARNLYFAHDICIWNRGRAEYLYAAVSQNNLSRRAIYTYKEGYLQPGGLWESVFFANVYFKNRKYDKEYLYASTTDKFNSAERHVLTWVDDGFVGDTCAWKIELNGDYCYFKNVNFNEYLYTSSKLYTEQRRYVFTAIRGAALHDPDFQWQIRNCE